MKRVVIYARYSTDLQNQRSIDDQLRLCRASLDVDEQILDICRDEARSGAFLINRPGLGTAIEMIRAGRVDVLLAENLDRISRSLSEMARIYELAAFHGTQIRTLHEGRIGLLHVGLAGMMNEIELDKIAKRTRRGQTGAVLAGRAAGDLPYGYEIDPYGPDGRLARGHRRIVPEQAAIVRRIFAEYVAGKPVTAIARDLTADGIPGPRAATWSASSIAGNAKRRSGMILNPIYVGQLVWNRNRHIKHPDTGKAQLRRNAEGDWTITEAPELRIIDDPTFAAARKRRLG